MVIGALVAAVVLVGGGIAGFFILGNDSDENGGEGSSGESGPTTMTVSGELVLGGQYIVDPGQSCSLVSGYEDISAGAPIVVSDAGGTMIAVGSLGGGEPTPVGETTDKCLYEFSIPDVPAEGDVYSIEIAGRGQVVFTAAQSEKISLTLGD